MTPGVGDADEGEFDHSQNDELRMCGLAGDDDEDDVREDCAELFGRSAADPLPCDQDAVPVHGEGADPDADGGDSEVVGSNRPSTSAVWDDFEKHFKKVLGKARPVRYAATCKHCKKQYSAYSANGTRHLTRHLKVCVKRREKCHMSQTQIGFNPDGSVRHWEYNADVARVELVRMLARLDLPLLIGETDAFKDYIKTAHNPAFAPVSKQTTARDLFKHFNGKREKLMTCLQDNVVSSVAVTSDIWSGKAKEDYLSVVAHFINADWQLEKRVLGLRLIDVSHNAENIAERVKTVLAEYGIHNKVFSVTLDNTSANKNAMDKLKSILKEYLGADLFLHQRCACYIINLIVKEALAAVNPLIDNFRTAISFLNSSSQRIAAYKSYCIASSVRPRKFSLDMDVRWNSTYLMLKTLLPHRNTFSTFIEANYPRPSMIDKYNKYWKNIPNLHSIAFILDPRAKIKGFTKVLRKLNSHFNVDYTNKLLDTRALLFRMYNMYDAMYGSVRLKRAVLASLSGKKRTAWADIYDDDEFDIGAGCSFLPPNLDQSRGVSATSLLPAASASNSSELASYLDSDTVSQLDDDFDLMQWWHEHKLTYPVLSILAKDIFTDWENAESRLQHMVEDKELEEAFEALYLDVD
ncbi:zinc finger BED domain-containing protein RICESLEEPER 2-like [Miscanthus floridulus]|uniref:zinc finger BED domain-containing protein RICESLEEPER 2-like n=1 Tax=Miscanthus floridulus TaxID=154761 RepID=UPI003458CDC0